MIEASLTEDVLTGPPCSSRVQLGPLLSAPLLSVDGSIDEVLAVFSPLGILTVGWARAHARLRASSAVTAHSLRACALPLERSRSCSLDWRKRPRLLRVPQRLKGHHEHLRKQDINVGTLSVTGHALAILVIEMTGSETPLSEFLL